MSLRDISSLALWSVSTAKKGYDVEQMRDQSTDWYWQSDGTGPHDIMLRFAKCMDIEMVQMYFDYKRDETYTPRRICVLSGTGPHDLETIADLELDEPQGWTVLCLDTRTHCLKISILSNHQNGKDCHVRGLKIYSPQNEHKDTIPYSSRLFRLYSTIR